MVDNLPTPSQISSSLCRQQDFLAPWYLYWRDRMSAAAPALPLDQIAVWGPVWEGMQGKWMHRKLWEWCAIAQALVERGALAAHKKGLGFAVGTEPLPSLFAAHGCDIVASDYYADAKSSGWAATGQLATSLAGIHWPKLIAEDDFRSRVTYMNVDMRDLKALPREKFDFTWSSCAFEHLGNLDRGITFVRNAMSCLRQGGIAVHTTEYNVSSNDKTVKSGPSVIYRRRDIEDLDRALRAEGCAIELLDFEAGAQPHDIAFDFPPYYRQGRQHVKLRLDGYISTSLLLIVRKA